MERDDDGVGTAPNLHGKSPRFVAKAATASTAAVAAADSERQQRRRQQRLGVVKKSPGATTVPNHRFTPLTTIKSCAAGGQAVLTSSSPAAKLSDCDPSCDVSGVVLEDGRDLEKCACGRLWCYAGGSTRDGSAGGGCCTFSSCTNIAMVGTTGYEDARTSHSDTDYPATRRLLGVRCRKRLREEEDGMRCCCSSVLTMLRFGFSTVTAAVTLLLMGMAVLITFWALFPVCTRCRHHYRGAAAERSVAAAAGDGSLEETGWSTLYINELQVSESFWLYAR